MADLKKITVDAVYDHFKEKKDYKYDEEKHCKILIKVMMDPHKGTLGSFCVEAMVVERTFYHWVEKHELFRNLYYFSKMVAREVWEEEGRKIKDREYQLGTVNYEFEHWKMIGWTRFGVSRNSRLKLNMKPGDNPAQHYAAILKQAGDGDFTASEFKQLMEAVNVGLNVHQVFELQNQINELKLDLETVTANRHVENPFSDKGT